MKFDLDRRDLINLLKTSPPDYDQVKNFADLFKNTGEFIDNGLVHKWKWNFTELRTRGYYELWAMYGETRKRYGFRRIPHPVDHQRSYERWLECRKIFLPIIAKQIKE